MAVICNLSTLMGKKRYTIEDVHQLTGLSRSTVSNLYNDKATRVDYTTIDRLCRLFSCKTDELLEYSNSTPSGETETAPFSDSLVNDEGVSVATRPTNRKRAIKGFEAEKKRK